MLRGDFTRRIRTFRHNKIGAGFIGDVTVMSP
jgi:hypothetical protein